MGTVYVVGAGLSKPAGAPLGSELLQTMRELAASPTTQPRRRLFLSGILAQVGLWFGNLGDWSFEEIFTITHSKTLFEAVTGKNFGKYERFRLDLIWAVIFALKTSVAGNPKRLLYDRFVNSLQESDIIISLNYDVILEEALVRKDGGFDCGIPRPKILNQSGGFENYTGRLLLKLHGSSNFLRCTSCGKWLVALGKVAERVLLPSRDAFHRSLRCVACTAKRPGRLLPVLVPPSFDKAGSLLNVGPLWQRAVTELHRAERVVFVGCSLNAADFDLEALFRTTIGNRKEVPLDVVCTDARLGTRFSAVFPKHMISVNPVGFERWVMTKADGTE